VAGITRSESSNAPRRHALEEVESSIEGWQAEVDRILDTEETIGHLIDDINRGMSLEGVLDHVFESFSAIIPYDRIGCSLVEENMTVRSRWARAVYPELKLDTDYSAPLQGSSLKKVLESGEPRIIPDLEEYLSSKPDSESTRLIVEEGIRSSLTCPLIVDGNPVGFLYFSSREPGTYDHQHIEIFRRIAGQVAVLVEKARLVSRLEEQRRQLAAQNAALTELNELKNRFIGMAAHDLRNPLGSIMMLAGYLEEELQVDSEHTEMIRDIRAQATHLLELVEDLLDLTKIESGRVVIDMEPMELWEFLEETIRRYRPIAAKKNTSIRLVEGPDGTVEADRQRLRQVLENLLSNATKFSPPGSAIEVHLIDDGRRWIVEIHDQGPGISESDRARLFEPFAKLSARPTDGETSSGLGLAICRHLVEAHNGEIGARSTPEGTAFWFSIPKHR